MDSLESEVSSPKKGELSLEEKIANHPLGGQKRYNRRPLIAFILIVLICTLIVPLCVNASNRYFPVAGGVCGMLCSGIVMVAYLRRPADSKAIPQLSLLFWRCVADLGLALRMIATPGFNQLICGQNYCDFQLYFAVEDRCAFASAMFEFFQISSEAWFVCVSADLYFSMTRPFSRFQDRYRYYHFFSWGMGLAFSLPTGISRSVQGFWYIATRHQGTGEVEESSIISKDVFCWIQIEPENPTEKISWQPWVFFYLPLLLSYGFSAAVLYNAFRRLKTGVSFTFTHRLRILFTNSINISTCLLYWTFLFVVYILTFAFEFADEKSAFLYNILMYLVPAKGISSVFVWILVGSIDFSIGSEVATSENVDLNTALREEVLLYASEGVRKSCKHFSGLQKAGKDVSGRLELTFALKQTSDQSGALAGSGLNDSEIISGKNFLMLVLGFQGPLIKIRDAFTTRLQAKHGELTNVRKSIIRQSLAPGTKFHGDDRPDFDMLATLQERGESTSDGDRVTSNPMQSGHNRHEMRAGPRPGSNKFEEAAARAKPSLHSDSTKSQIPLHLVGDDDTQEVDKVSDDFVETSENVVQLSRFASFWASVKTLMHNSFCWVFNSGEQNSVEFTEFAPYHFGRVRKSVGIGDDLYRFLFLERVKERLTSGGASGAFFFFSKDEFLIAKSCTDEEADVLRGNAEQYADYICQNKESYISKIYGVYLLKIYDTKLYFMVMNNIFLNDKGHHNLVKYDIKGSWVSRNAALPRNGDLVTCKYCEQKYVYSTAKRKKKSFRKRDDGGKSTTLPSSTDTDSNNFAHAQLCTETVDKQHEALVIYKDSDLREKILLPGYTAQQLLAQLKKDAGFLHSVGVMDYSLLMGVHYTKYAVNTELPVEADDEDEKVKRYSDDIEQGFENAMGEHAAMKQLQYCVPLEVGRVVGPDCYYLGIIDFQQKWTWNKVMERFLKVFINRKDPDGLSAIDVDTYFHRFCEKMEDLFHFDHENDDDASSTTSANSSTNGSPRAISSGNVSTPGISMLTRANSGNSPSARFGSSSPRGGSKGPGHFANTSPSPAPTNSDL